MWAPTRKHRKCSLIRREPGREGRGAPEVPQKPRGQQAKEHGGPLRTVREEREIRRALSEMPVAMRKEETTQGLKKRELDLPRGGREVDSRKWSSLAVATKSERARRGK